MLEAISNYDSQLRAQIFLNTKLTDCKDYGILKEAHQRLRESSILLFKEKAVGQNLKDFEHKINEAIQKKFIAVKSKCLEIYDKKCQDSLQQDIESLESEIR